MKLSKVVAVLLSIVMAATVFAGCGNSSKPAAKTDAAVGKSDTAAVKDSSKPTDTAKSSQKRKFAIVYPVVHPFFVPVIKQSEDYAKEKGYELIQKSPDKFDVQLQIEIMENLIAMKVDGIGIGSADPKALAPYLDKAIAAGIKVVTFDSDTPESKRSTYIGTNNYTSGKQYGKVLGKAMNGKGKIIMLTGVPSQLGLIQRMQGIKDTLKKYYPEIQIVDTQASQGDPLKAVQLIEDMIKAHPDFDAYVGIDGVSGPAAISVWKAKGWTGKDKLLTAYDNVPLNIQGIKEGQVTFLISQMQHTWGAHIMDTLNDLCDGKEVPALIDTGSVEINSSNVDTYMNDKVYVDEDPELVFVENK